jgi:hypothetical protein
VPQRQPWPVAASQPQPQPTPQAQAAAAGAAFAEAASAWQPQAQPAPAHWTQLQEGVVLEAVFIEVSWWWFGPGGSVRRILRRHTVIDLNETADF